MNVNNYDSISSIIRYLKGFFYIRGDAMLYLLSMVFLQIVVESLPVSSSGHCALWTYFLDISTTIKTCIIPVDIDFLLHIPTIAIVTLYFSDAIVWYLLNIRYMYKKIGLYALSSFIAGLITSVGYVLIRKLKLFSISYSLGFFITGMILSSLFFCKIKQTKRILTVKDAILLGCVQACALLPGISRFASTFVAARWLGFHNYYAFAHSFAIHIPLLVAASLKALYGICNGSVLIDYFTIPVLLVSFFATIVSYSLFVWVGRLVIAGTLQRFAWYVFGASFLAYFYGI